MKIIWSNNIRKAVDIQGLFRKLTLFSLFRKWTKCLFTVLRNNSKTYLKNVFSNLRRAIIISRSVQIAKPIVSLTVLSQLFCPFILQSILSISRYLPFHSILPLSSDVHPQPFWDYLTKNTVCSSFCKHGSS